MAFRPTSREPPTPEVSFALQEPRVPGTSSPSMRYGNVQTPTSRMSMKERPKTGVGYAAQLGDFQAHDASGNPHHVLSRDSSQIRSVLTNFVGLSAAGDESAISEKTRWDQRRLRRLASKYSCKPEEIAKELKSFDQVVLTNMMDPAGTTPSSLMGTPHETYTVEYGMTPSSRQTRTGPAAYPYGRPSMSAFSGSISGAPEVLSTFARQHSRADSSSLQKEVKTPLRTPKAKESMASVVWDSVSSLIRTGTTQQKRKHAPIAARSSFDVEQLNQRDLHFPQEEVLERLAEEASPVVVVVQPTPAGASFEMTPIHRPTPVDSVSQETAQSFDTRRIRTTSDGKVDSVIPEETSFDLENAAVDDELPRSAPDPPVLGGPQMGQRMRRGASARRPHFFQVSCHAYEEGDVPCGSLLEPLPEEDRADGEETPSASTSAGGGGGAAARKVHRHQTFDEDVLSRPTDLYKTNKPFISQSASMPSGFVLRKKSESTHPPVDVHTALIEKSEEEDSKASLLHTMKKRLRKSWRSRGGRWGMSSSALEGHLTQTTGGFSQLSQQRQPHPLSFARTPKAERSVSVVDEMFFDAPPLPSQPTGGRLESAAMVPALSAYHPDAASPPRTPRGLQPTIVVVPDKDVVILGVDAHNWPTNENLVQHSRQPYGSTMYGSDGDAPTMGSAPLPGISRIDIGDASINTIERVPLRPPLAKVDVGLPSRPFSHTVDSTVSRKTLTRQPAIDYADSRQLREVQMDAIAETMVEYEKSKRTKRYRGIGALGNLCGRKLGRNKMLKLPDELRQRIEDGEEERPYFTCWMTTIQVVVCIVSILAYGVGPFSFSRVERTGEVMDTTLVYRTVGYYEPPNMWAGPKFADLIQLGAKYTPCMRRDPVMWSVIQEDRDKERATGCCIYNDKSGCFQTGESSCPRSVATWIRWQKQKPQGILKKSKSDSSLLRNQNATALMAMNRKTKATSRFVSHLTRSSGAVCGQDPSYCETPPSVVPHEWKDDITEWPICTKTRWGDYLPEHMKCEVTGRPCCIQLQGLCRITTRQYCDFVNGHWNENATLCSQVDCFSQVCGMLPFLHTNHPNQFYRLVFSLFLHAGLIHLVLTVTVQMWLMRDLEKLIGWVRMAILYMVSGVGGNLASAIFVPYNPEVGPSGAHAGIIASLVVDLHVVENPGGEFVLYCVMIFGLFLIGIFPWVDNWAHIFGFLSGLCTTIVIFPYLDFPPKTTKAPSLAAVGDLSNGATTMATPTSPLPYEGSTAGHGEVAESLFFNRHRRAVRFFYQYKLKWTKVRVAVCQSLLLRPHRKEFLEDLVIVITALAANIVLFGLLFYILYYVDDFNCAWCVNLNCVDLIFPDHFCDNQGEWSICRVLLQVFTTVLSDDLPKLV